MRLGYGYGGHGEYGGYGGYGVQGVVCASGRADGGRSPPGGCSLFLKVYQQLRSSVDASGALPVRGARGIYPGI